MTGVLGQEPRDGVVGAQAVVVVDLGNSFRSASVVVDEEGGVVVNLKSKQWCQRLSPWPQDILLVWCCLLLWYMKTVPEAPGLPLLACESPPYTSHVPE